MAAMNGTAIHTPPASLDPTSVIGKRKRSTSPEKTTDNHKSQSEATASMETGKQFQDNLSMLLKIIESYDSGKAILSKPLPAADNAEPNNKRVRLSERGGEDNVSSRIQEGSYSSIDAVVDDLQTVLDQQAALVNGEAAHAGDITQYTALKKILNKFASEKLLQNKKVKAEEASETTISEIKVPDADSIPNRVALTLVGSTDRGPKQLFSSLQLVSGLTEDARSNGPSTKIRYPKVEEDVLPNGITATKIVPFNSQEAANDKKRTATFGQIFRPHHSLKPLEPPKPAKSSPKASTLTWARPSVETEFSKVTPAEKGDYKFSPLPTGQWLRYAGPKTATELIAYNEQLSREKGIGFGDRAHPVQPSNDDVQAAREKALFFSAYSSFGPVHDDGESIISEKVKSQIWWSKSGSNRFRALLGPIEVPSDVPPSFSEEETTSYEALADDDFSEAVASFAADHEDVDEDTEAVSEKEMDDILEEVSDHLKTLVSYQHIRHSSSLSARATVGEQGTFSSPSSAENEIYQLLKTQLSLMISSLPPYAVAKLDGDQLRALNISTGILTTQEEYSGVMEVDEFTYAKQRATASANAAINRPAGLPQARSGSYNAAVTPAGGYNARAYGLNARPATSTPLTARSAYAGATPSQNYATTPRPMAQTVQRFGGVQQPYNNSPNVQQFQRPIPNGYGGSYNSHQQAQNAASGFMQRPTQPGYQQRAQDTAARSASPQKPLETAPRAQFPGAPFSAQPARYFQQPQQPPTNQTSPSPTIPMASTASQNSAYTAQMERARLQAQAASQRPTSTPQASISQHQGQNRTPAVGQQNGVPVMTPGQGQ